MRPISAVIPNRNGAQLLRSMLPPLLEELARRPHEILVVDDGSVDSSCQLLHSEFPVVETIRLDASVGFGAACNLGFAQATHNTVLLLNTDMVVTPGSVQLLARHFARHDLFAVGPHYVTPGDCLDGASPASGRARPQIVAPGGGGLFSRDKLLELGGFDSIYHPFYWEDIDIGWNAWRRGWRVMYEPSAVFHHARRATIGAHYSPQYIDRVRARNRCLFGWKNFRSPHLLALHAWAICRNILGDCLKRRSLCALVGLLTAIPLAPRAIASRRTFPGEVAEVDILRRVGEGGAAHFLELTCIRRRSPNRRGLPTQEADGPRGQ